MKIRVYVILLFSISSNCLWAQSSDTLRTSVSQTTTSLTSPKPIVENEGPITDVISKSPLGKQWQKGEVFEGRKPEEELTELRTEISKKFDLGNGRKQIILGGPFHYLDPEGYWQDIDINIKESTDKQFPFSNIHNKYTSRFGKINSDGVEMNYHNKTISFGQNTSLRAGKWQPAKSNAAEIAIVNDNVLSYNSIFSNIDLEYEVSVSGIYHRLIFNNPDVFSGLTSQQNIHIEEELELPTNAVLADSQGIITTSRQLHGQVYIIVDNDTTFTISSPHIWDDTYTQNVRGKVGTDISNNDISVEASIVFLGQKRIKYIAEIPTDWLLSLNRTYPIVFDPTIYVGGLSSPNLLGYPYPFNTCRYQRVSQILFRQNDIGFAGTVTNVHFYQNAANPLPSYNLNISLKDVSYSNMSSSTLETGLTSRYLYTPGFTLNASNAWWNFTITPFTHANTNLLVEAKFNSCGQSVTSSCLNSCPPTFSAGGSWGSFSAGYNAHRWAYSNSSSCSFSPPKGNICPSTEGNPAYGNIVPFCKIDITTSTTSCSNWAVTPSSQSVTASGGNFSATVSASGSCSYNLTFNNSSWIHFTGYGSNGVFNYSVDPNTGTTRSGTISVNDVTNSVNNIVTLTINQSAGSSCPTITSTPSHSNVTICHGYANGSIFVNNVNGGTSPYQYSINGGSNWQTSSSFSNLSAGTYQVRVRDNNNCLSSNQPVTISEPNPVTFSPFPTNANCYSCNNGSINISASGGTPAYQYSKNGGSSWQSSNIFTGLSAGTYFIQVRDANNCMSIVQSVTITEPPQPPVVSLIIPTNNNIYAGESIHFSGVVSNNPSGWNWTFKGGDQYSITISNLKNPTVVFNRPGTYKVSLSASNVAGTGNTYQTQVGFITVKPTFLVLSSPRENYVIQDGYPSKKEAEPVNIATGSYEYSHTDFDIPAIKTRLQFSRRYNSVNRSDTRTLGYGWTHNYDYSVDNQDDTLWVVHYGDGHSSYFVPLYNGNGTSFPLSHGTMETLKKNTGTSTYTLTYKTGEVYQFNSSGRITSMVDLNSNTTSFTYSGNNLTTITAPGGRTLTLTYSSSRVASVTDQLSRSVLFSYDTNNNLLSVTDVDSGVTHFTYDNHHRITSIILPLGDTLLSNVYDSTGRVIAQSDAYQETTTFNYDSPDFGYITITYPDNNSIVVQHDSLYRLIAEEDELGNIKTFTYDQNNRPIVLTDENGVATQNTYDTLGNLTKRQMPEGIINMFSYNSMSKPTRIIDPLGDTSTFTYDTGLNPIQISLPGNRSIHNTYYSNGLLKTTKDPMGYITEFFYNSRGDLTSVVSHSGTKIFGYDSVGRLISYTDENQHKTTYTYNTKDKLVKVTDALGYSLEDSFDINDNLVLSRDKNGNETQFSYDKKDRLKEVLLPNSGIVQYIYDKRDNIEKVTDANGNNIIYDYDIKQRLKTITSHLGVTEYGYDKTSNRTSLKDANNNTSYFEYDSLYRLTIFKDALSNNYTYDRDERNLTTSIKDPLNRITNFTYNSSEFLTTVSDARSKHADMAYDDNGNITSLKDLNGHIQHFAYDSSNRLVMHKDASNNVDSFYYDGVGNLIKIVKPTGTIIKTFDSANRLTEVINSTGDTYEYTYDGNGNILTITNNSGTSQFTYDEMNRIKRYIDVFGDTVQYAYDSVGNRTKIIYPGGHIVTYGYNQANLLETVTDWLGHTTSYKYDPAGQLISSINPFGDTCKYGYDNTGRLVEQVNVIGDSIITKSVFTLNAAGEKEHERIVGPVPHHLKNTSYAYTYEPNDELTSDSVTSYTNDGAGNRLSGDNSYTFTVDNLLKSIGSTTYTYDALGNRVTRSNNGTYTRYVLDLQTGLSQVLQERDTNGIVSASYIYGLDLIARIDSNNNIQYYHFDAQHNTVALSDDSGMVTDTYVYEPFGLLIEHIGNTEQPYTFLGQYGIQQEDSIIYYIRARYYDAANQRFISKDVYPATFTDPHTLNRYVYGLNNPVSVFDVTGLYGEKDNSKKSLGTRLLDGLQVGLDIGGLIPGVGEFADGANALIYFARGDETNALLSAGAMIPFAGWGATAAKWGIKGGKVLKKFKSVDNLLEHAYDFKTLSDGKTIQAILKGNPSKIFSDISKNADFHNGLYYLSDGTIIGKHYSKTTGVFTIDINKNGNIFKIRIE